MSLCVVCMYVPIHMYVGTVLTLHVQSPGFDPQGQTKLHVEVHAWNPSTQEVEEESELAHGHP